MFCANECRIGIIRSNSAKTFANLLKKKEKYGLLTKKKIKKCFSLLNHNVLYILPGRHRHKFFSSKLSSAAAIFGNGRSQKMCISSTDMP